ncbi:cytochrome c550 [Isoalcanivorax pacificus W11-5]|uniref:Cytochrome c550 n=1 Tax=Isoalcanivorax pacificus W11-5 TaxID=391936 RepID=A0A0B4XMI3_9GAMM|nr:cytochrome c550 [Isoalcanivorax pacificus W11-5]
MNTTTRMILGVMLLGGTLFAHGHGNVTPQGVDLRGLELLGDTWRDTNPYREAHPQHALAVDVGRSAYNQNCAACHGLEAKSGGIAPDLRELENGDYGDEWYKERVVNGAVRDGRVLMPKMADYLSQEALWAIRSWLETVSLQTTGQ